jgi:hypothetical protein
VGYSLVVLRVEALAFRVYALKAFLGKDVEQRACNLFYVRTAAMGECQVRRVQHREQFFDKGGGGIFDRLTLLALNTFAVVVKLGLEAEQGLEVLVALARQFARRGQRRVLATAVRATYLVRRAIYVLAAFICHA